MGGLTGGIHTMPRDSQGDTDNRFSVKQRNAIHEEYQGKIEILKKENSSVREQMDTYRKQKTKADAELSQTKAMLRGHNDLVMSSKLREVEIEKVKEFAELVQGDLEQADQDLTTLEACLLYTSPSPRD